MINKIKNILKIIISVYLIIICARSCSKAAVDLDELYEYADLVSVSPSANTNIKYTANKFIQYYAKVVNFFNANNLEYNGIYLQGYNGGYISLYCTNEIFTYTTVPSNGFSKYFYQITINQDNGNVQFSSNGNAANIKIYANAGFGLFKFSQSNVNYNNWFINFNMVNRFNFDPNYDNIVEVEGYNGTINAIKFSYTGNNIYLGEITKTGNFQKIMINLGDLTSNFYLDEQNKYIQVSGNDLFINNNKIYIPSRLLNYNKVYSLVFSLYNDIGDDYSNPANSTSERYIFLPQNAVISGTTITNYGSGDFTNQDATNTQIGFTQQLYDNLFKMKENYVEDKLTEMKNEFNISGDKEIEEDILNIIQNQSDDFVISWENINTPYLKLSGDSINFSALERSNPKLQEVMQWERTLLGFSLGALLLRNYWTTFLKILGIGTEVYDKNNEEKYIVNIQDNTNK